MSNTFLAFFIKYIINLKMLLKSLECSCILVRYFSKKGEKNEQCKNLWVWFAAVWRTII